MSNNVPDIRPAPGGPRPLDKALFAALQDYNTSFHLVPLPTASSFSKHEDRASAFSQPYVKGKGKKGKGKGKDSSGSNFAPRGMLGCIGKDAKGRALCFDYNLGSCKRAPAGGTCPKGRHVCFKAKCQKVRAFKDAHASELPDHSNKE